MENWYLYDALERLSEDYRKDIRFDSKVFCNVNFATAYQYAHGDPISKEYAIDISIPLRKAGGGFTIATDDTRFKDHVQLETGLIVPRWLAQESGFAHHQYKPHKVMFLNIRGQREGSTLDIHSNPYELETNLRYTPLEEIDLSDAPIN